MAAFAFADEEVHGNMITPGSQAAIHDLGRSTWLESFNPHHLDDCSHFQIIFYDEVFDVICREIQAATGCFVEKSRPSKSMQADS